MSDTFIMEIKRTSVPLDGTKGSHSMMKVSDVLAQELVPDRKGTTTKPSAK